MHTTDDAIAFRRLTSLAEKDLLRELELTSIPKKIKTGNGYGRDDFGYYLWLLRRCFRCNVTEPVRVDQFQSLESLVKNTKRVKFPLVLSIAITEAKYEHVICLWRDMIIDFEEESTIRLTEKILIIHVVRIPRL